MMLLTRVTQHSISNQPTLLPIEIGRFLFIKLISGKILFDFMFEKKYYLIINQKISTIESGLK